MSIMILLIVCSFCIAVVFLGVFLYAVRNGQFSDQTTPALKLLYDDIPSEQADDGTHQIAKNAPIP